MHGYESFKCDNFLLNLDIGNQSGIQNIFVAATTRR